MHNVITDTKILMQRYIIRDGFIFTAITHPGNVYDAIVLRVPSDAPCSSPLMPKPQRSLEDHIKLINKKQIEKALIIADSLNFILDCPNLKHIRVLPTDNANENFSFSPLYCMPSIISLQCRTSNDSANNQPKGKRKRGFCIDYANFPNLESVSISEQGHKNYNKINTLKRLGISGYSGVDLNQMFSSPNLSTLTITQSKIKTLEGIEQSKKMQCFYLYYNRSLCDISALRKVKNTLRALRIENCPRIEDFSVLGELENLELLELSGSNELPSLDFLKKMKNLKTFTFSVNVKDGDLSPCKNLAYAYSSKNRKHYNLKDADLPKGQYVRGNETLPEWLRSE